TAQAKLHSPKKTEEASSRTAHRAEAIPMKGNVPGFVAQDKRAHGRKRRNGTVPLQQPIIGGAGNLGQQQDLQFETHSEDAAAVAKGSETPMGVDALATHSIHGASEQARVL